MKRPAVVIVDVRVNTFNRLDIMRGMKDMTNQNCMECGLSDYNQAGNKLCLALKRTLNSGDLNREWGCYYYISIIKENGERLTPFEHYLIKLDEIEKKKVSVISTALA